VEGSSEEVEHSTEGSGTSLGLENVPRVEACPPAEYTAEDEDGAPAEYLAEDEDGPKDLCVDESPEADEADVLTEPAGKDDVVGLVNEEDASEEL